MEPSEIYAVQPSHVPRIEHPLACPVLSWRCPSWCGYLWSRLAGAGFPMSKSVDTRKRTRDSICHSNLDTAEAETFYLGRTQGSPTHPVASPVTTP